MSSGIQALETTYHFLFVGVLIVLGIMLFLCLIRACMGPTVADRLVSVNMMGTMVMTIMAILAVMMNESYLVDICIIYAMISFLAVIVLSKVIMGVHKEEEKMSEEQYTKGVQAAQTEKEQIIEKQSKEIQIEETKKIEETQTVETELEDKNHAEEEH